MWRTSDISHILICVEFDPLVALFWGKELKAVIADDDIDASALALESRDGFLDAFERGNNYVVQGFLRLKSIHIPNKNSSRRD